MEIETNVVYEHLDESDKRIVIEQGGSRSGKTYNILFWLVVYCKTHSGKVITICRATFPSIRGSVMRDLFNILEQLNLYNAANHNKTEATYLLNGNIIEFISIDQPQKVRGRKRDVLFINEANEIDFESWTQLSMRTTEKIIIDYNPSITENHWILSKVKTREDADFYITTYKDNPFLEAAVRNEIERLREVDENYWKIYGLGILGQIQGVIFTNWAECSAIPDTANLVGYGLDFGYTHDPSSLIAVYLQNNELWVKELIYETGLTNQDLANRMTEIGVYKNSAIYADSSEPKSIAEIYRMGFNVHGVKKGKDSIINGIDILKRYKINVTSDSTNLIKELRNYKWATDKEGSGINVPVDSFNHAIDALRYCCMMTLNKRRQMVF